MSDERTPPAEPEPGSTEWLLAQLSGGRIDSRRERREAEAALEAAGVPLPDAAQASPEEADPTTEPATGQAEEPPAVVPEERPKARFSWETGTLEAVNAARRPEPDAAPEPVVAPEPAAASDSTVAPQAPVVPQPVAASEPAPLPEPPMLFSAGTETDVEARAEAAWPSPIVPEAAPAPSHEPVALDGATPFRWNLSPTAEPDPAVNPPAEQTPPSSPQPEFFTSAAPLVVPKPVARPQAPEVPAAAEPSVVFPTAPSTPEPQLPVPPSFPSIDEFTIPDEVAPVAASLLPTEPIDEPLATAQAEAAEPVQSAEPAQTPEPVETPETSEASAVTSDWSDIADMLGAHPQTVDTGIVSPMPPVAEILPSFDAVLPRASAANTPTPPVAPPPSANAPVEHGRGGNRLNRWLLIAAAVLLAIIIAIVLFAVGRSLAAGGDQTPVAATHSAAPSASPSTASPSPTPTTSTAVQVAAGTGPVAPGQSYQWDQLRGGECIDPFSSPWAQQFAVVDCNAQHAAQLVYTAPVNADPSAAFPGEQAIASQITLLCSKPGVVDLNAAAAYNDVQLVAAYPVDAAQWSAGQRNYYCFVTRSSGQAFSSSIAGPGPTQ